MANEIRALFEKLVLAAFNVLVLVAFMLLHWIVEELFHLMLHERAPKAEQVLFALFLVAFTMVYINLLWETVGIFVPRFERWRRKIVGSKIRKG